MKIDDTYKSFFKLTNDDITIMDKLIDKRLRAFTYPGCHRASLEHFIESGKASGTFRTELHALLMEFLETKSIQQPIQPVKSLQEIKDELAQKDGYAHWSEYITIQKDAFHIPELLNALDTAAELYASQFKTPPVQEDQNLLSVISDLGAWINQEIDITEDQEKLFKESKNRDMAARCDSSIRTYQKVIRRIEELKSKYTIISKNKFLIKCNNKSR